MDATYQWFEGASPVDPVWPLVPSLMPDELISSWLVRCALALGCDPITLTNFVWPRVRFWCNDPDKGLSDSQSRDLEKYAGLQQKMLMASSLASIRCALSVQNTYVNGVTPWILCLGLRNRRRSGGLQYCPQCFFEREAFFNIQSRLAWHCACPQHQLMLLDSCQCCGAPLCPHLLSPPETDLSRCHRCRFELKLARSEYAGNHALSFQHAADGLFFGEEQTYGGEHLSLADWFYLSRWILGMLRCAARARSACMEPFFRTLGLNFTELLVPSLGLPFQYLDPKDRAHLMSDTWCILQLGQQPLAQACAEFSVARSLMPLPAGNPPRCIASIVSESQSRRHKNCPSYHSETAHSDKNVLMQWRKLLRKIQR